MFGIGENQAVVLDLDNSLIFYRAGSVLWGIVHFFSAIFK